MGGYDFAEHFGGLRLRFAGKDEVGMGEHLDSETNNAWWAWGQDWDAIVLAFVNSEMAKADAGHDVGHVKRVVRAAEIIGKAEGAEPMVVLPAAWLHDCVVVAKDSPQRSLASRMAAERAREFLSSVGYAREWLLAIEHAIAAHSFSAAIEPETIEAKVVQDADRLEAIGALGLARCLMTGGAMGRQLLHAREPFPVEREPDDAVSSLDHLFVKLLKLPRMMQTVTGRSMADERAAFLVEFLRELAGELGVQPGVLERALERVREGS